MTGTGITIAIIIGIAFVLRSFRAWMLRTDEIIKHQREMIALMKEGRKEGV